MYGLWVSSPPKGLKLLDSGVGYAREFAELSLGESSLPAVQQYQAAVCFWISPSSSLSLLWILPSLTRCEGGLKRRTLKAAVGSYQEAWVSPQEGLRRNVYP